MFLDESTVSIKGAHTFLGIEFKKHLLNGPILGHCYYPILRND